MYLGAEPLQVNTLSAWCLRMNSLVSTTELTVCPRESCEGKGEGGDEVSPRYRDFEGVKMSAAVMCP